MLRHRAAAVLLGLTGLVAAGLAAVPIAERAMPDAVLAKHYGAALAGADSSWSSLGRNIWLSGLGGTGIATGRTLAAGDTITITAGDGRPRVIEVVSLELIDGEPIGMPGVRFQLITGHAAGEAEGSVVRFMFASEGPTSAPMPAPADRVL